jgi:hypothetical protein
MKKHIAMAAIAMSLMASGCSDGVFTTSTTNSLMQPDYNYEIDTWGSNSEVYEFTPRGNPKKTCVFVMLDSGRAMGLQCFDKPIANK